jgi:hypothetical protein
MYLCGQGKWFKTKIKIELGLWYLTPLSKMSVRSKYKTRNSRNIPKYKTRHFKVRYRKKYFSRLHKLETAV